MVDDVYVEFGEYFEDPGAAAEDDVDGDVSNRITSRGLSSVTTVAPTLPGEPHVIEYTGRSPQVASRVIVVSAGYFGCLVAPTVVLVCHRLKRMYCETT